MDFKVAVEFSPKELRAIKKKLTDVSRPLVTFTKEKTDAMKRQFKEGKDPYGKPWKPLKQSTIDSKKQNKDKILVHRGNLKNSIRRKTDKLYFRIRLEEPYAIYHQLGTRKMAQREILAITKEDTARIRELITVFIGLKKRGRGLA